MGIRHFKRVLATTAIKTENKGHHSMGKVTMSLTSLGKFTMALEKVTMNLRKLEKAAGGDMN